MKLTSLLVLGAAVAGAQGTTPPTAASANAQRPDLSIVPTRSIKLDTDEGSWISLDVSPDGRTLVFDLLGDLYTLPIDGGTATQITKGMQYDAQPRYSPDGKWLAFVSDKDGGDNVWILEVATGKLKQVTKGKGQRYRSPEWTPDGDYIVVSRSANIGPSKPWMFHKAGGSGIQLVQDPTPSNGAQPQSLIGAAFGKDDRYIWFASRQGSWEYNAGFPQYSLVTKDRKTGAVETRAYLNGGAVRPALSPDGKYLAYGSRYESQTGIRLRDLETGDEKWLAYPVQRDEQEAVASLDALPGYSFTPDSRAIIISYGGKMWRVPVDGSAQTQIPFRVQASIDLGPKVEFKYPITDSTDFTVKQLRDAVPSPDGRRLAFVALDKVYVMDLPGGTPRRVSSAHDTEAQPAWSPDGSQLAYVTWTDSGGHLYKVSASGGTPQRLSQRYAQYSAPVWSPNGQRIIVTQAPAQSVIEEGGFVGGAVLAWVPASGGAATPIAAASGRRNVHFTTDTSRIFTFGNGGISSMRWDGSDEQTHVRITGALGAGATTPSAAIWAQLSPDGGSVLTQVANDLYLFPLIRSGGAPTISLASLDNAQVPARRLTDVGGQFPAWSGDGRLVHFSIGNSFFTYDIARARALDDSVAAAREGAAATTGEATARYEPSETKVIVRAKRDIPQGTVVYRGARIVTMKGSEVIANGDIVVTNNRIAAIGRSGSVRLPRGAKVIDAKGKTIIPGFVDTHAHLGLQSGIHAQPNAYLANLAFGVTTTRDPQTGTTDVLSYEDMVQAGEALGPRIYSTGPGLFSSSYIPSVGEDIKSLDDARRVMKRYSQYYDTKTLKMYVGGNRQQRQWILTAAREQRIMPTTEGALDTKYDMTMAIDGYPGQEHSIPMFPFYKDVIALFAQSGIAYTPTLIVSYNGPWGENYWYTNESPYDDAKLQRFTPYEELAGKTRRRVRGSGSGGNNAGWFAKDEYSFAPIGKMANAIVKAGGIVGVGSHGQLQGLGYHWEMWMLGMGGMANHDVLRCATIFGAQAIGLASDIGSIEVGKLADFLILDRNPLDNIRNTNTARMIVKNGRVYDANTLDEIWPRQRKAPVVKGTAQRPKVGAGIP